jgi:anti-sigma regulatory factor (Ser/Thr protein kinase)
VTDEITLTLPRQRPFYRIAHLVLGGLAVRLDLTFENLEDLQLALAGLLDRPGGNGEVTVSVRVESDAICTLVGPFADESLRDELERGNGDEAAVSLSRLLGTVVDGVDLNEREGGLWVEVTKRVDRASR